MHICRPYHTLAILEEANEMVAALPIDASPTLVQFLRVLSPFKNLQELAADADLPLTQVGCCYIAVVVYVVDNNCTLMIALISYYE